MKKIWNLKSRITTNYAGFFPLRTQLIFGKSNECSYFVCALRVFWKILHASLRFGLYFSEKTLHTRNIH